jgi:outer membrane receptor protein involved in Fe transport
MKAARSRFIAVAGRLLAIALVIAASYVFSIAQGGDRVITGTIVTDKREVVEGATIIVRASSGEQSTTSDANGDFRVAVPRGPVTLRVQGKNLEAVEKSISADESGENLSIRIKYIIPPVHESVVIQAEALDPTIDQRNDTLYKNSVFVRDDQLIQTLNAGINVGQHEGGGKSLEIRRFGYNLDHGGVNGGLKVLVDDVQQNQGTQGHGQGYLGQLKSLSPELIADVDILNGPFSAQYGDFSGLGVVQIHLKESLPQQFTMRMQGGSFDSRRVFLAYSPQLERARSFIAYDYSFTNGPFENPGRYRRDNVTGNYTRDLNESQTLGFKLNLGRNNFFSSGQLPLDEVAAGRLDRFWFIDPFNGGRVRTGLFSGYFKQDFKENGVLKFDGFLGRSLFDLFSNFTFFLADPVFGDEIQQHDSRLQESINAQYLRPYRIFGQHSLLTAGANFHSTQINVGLYPSIERVPNRLQRNRDFGIDNPAVLLTSADATVSNTSFYAQQMLDLMNGRLHLEVGLRFDYFRFTVSDGVNETPMERTAFSGRQGASKFQPKAAVAYTVSDKLPFTFYLNYGRGINSQDARGVVQQPDSPRIATTDFYQVSIAYNSRRLSLSSDYFLIDHSNEQVYIPDDGTFEFKGPSRATGYELKVSSQITNHLVFNAGLTQVTQSFFRGTSPRVYVDSSPHTVANARLSYSGFRGFYGTLGYRHIGNYRLDGEDANIRASGLDVLDFSLNQRIRKWVDFNFSVDNLTDKHYFETQNFFESRIAPGVPAVAQIHATPGSSIGVTFGLTFHFFNK